jgi:hypothetical protein
MRAIIYSDKPLVIDFYLLKAAATTACFSISNTRTITTKEHDSLLTFNYKPKSIFYKPCGGDNWIVQGNNRQVHSEYSVDYASVDRPHNGLTKNQTHTDILKSIRLFVLDNPDKIIRIKQSGPNKGKAYFFSKLNNIVGL